MDDAGGIGGFIDLEFPRDPAERLHDGCVRTASGRASFRLLLETFMPRRVHLPHYLCDSVLEPHALLGIPCAFYRLGADFLPVRAPALAANEWILYVNYFGLMGRQAGELAARYGDRLILDNTQAFYHVPARGQRYFNSARKFLGVPDGSFVRVGPGAQRTPRLAKARRVNADHLVNRYAGRQQLAYAQYQLAERRVDCELREMSRFSAKVIDSARHAEIRRRRRENYRTYHRLLSGINELALPPLGSQVPYAYPLLMRTPPARSVLAERGVFVPTLWPEVLGRCAGAARFERRLARDLLALPLDQRYGAADCAAVVEMLRS